MSGFLGQVVVSECRMQNSHNQLATHSSARSIRNLTVSVSQGGAKKYKRVDMGEQMEFYYNEEVRFIADMPTQRIRYLRKERLHCACS